MSVESSGPLLDDSEDVYRAILYPLQWAEAQGRPSSAAFDEEVFSVDRKSKTSPERTVARFRMTLHRVEFNCGEASTLGFETRDELDPAQPDNDAHAHVYYRGSAKRKTQARKLAERCVSVVWRSDNRYIEAFPPVQALGRIRLQELANEWLQTAAAKECSIEYVVVNADASGFDDIRIKPIIGIKKGELLPFPADKFLRFVIDREFRGPMRDALHAHLVNLRRQVGVNLYQWYQLTVDVDPLP